MTPPVIILVRPQLGENIGLAARAMANFGLSELRLSCPRDLWPNPSAILASASASQVINKAQVYYDTDASMADLHYVFAATVRPRRMEKSVFIPSEAVGQTLPERWGILFGPENAGLSNEEISKANALIHIPTSPLFGSLNLSHAVAICCYEWGRLLSLPPHSCKNRSSEEASKLDVSLLLDHLEQALEESGFFLPAHKKEKMVWNLRSVFQRARLTQQEVRTLRGAVRALKGTS